MYLAAIGPKNLELAGELFDGWLAIFYAPEYADELLASIAAGRAKAGKTMDGFDVVPTVPVVIGDDLEACAAAAARLRVAVHRRHGQPRAELLQPAGRPAWATKRPPQEVQDQYLAKDYAGAAAAVPFEFIDKTSLIGPPRADPGPAAGVRGRRASRR